MWKILNNGYKADSIDVNDVRYMCAAEASTMICVIKPLSKPGGKMGRVYESRIISLTGIKW